MDNDDKRDVGAMIEGKQYTTDALLIQQPNNGILDDEAIYAMYRNEPPENPVGEEQSVGTPFSVDMQGSNISMTHCNHIQIGTTSVTPLTGESPSPAMRSDVSPLDSFDAISLPSSVTSASQLPNSAGFTNYPEQSIASTDSRRFSEGLTEHIPKSYQVNVNTNCESRSNCSSNKVLSRAMSTPSSVNDSLMSSRNALQLAPIVADSQKQSQLSADIKNSSNVQMGTQIVYNYYISENTDQARPPHCSSVSLPEITSLANVAPSDTSKNFLVEFREKLVSVYQNRARSSPLPWHRGKQLIPINEYYTEPQIFGVDNFGNKTTEMVNLISVLEEGHETRLLVEGEAGMGKTFLATKLAEEWAKGVHLKRFNILFLITLGDVVGSLQQYVREELLPSYYEEEKFAKIWEYCKSHDWEVLFVLDGYDELQRHDKGQIENLIKSKDFPESKVVVTCRPNMLQVMEKTIVVSGFGQNEILEFIGKYFGAIGNDTGGQSLRKIIEKDDQCWKLAKRPLFCVLLCMLFITGDMGDSLPKRQCDVMLQIILCLIKWNRKNDANASIDFDALPAEYEKPFFYFGKLCVTAMKNATTRFSEQDVQNVEGYDSKLKKLGFLYSDNESHALGEKKFWKPVHQTFLEYLGAFYIAKHIKECKGCKECKDFNTIFQTCSEVLKFCVGILNNKAYKLFDGQRYPFMRKLSKINLLRLLKEAEPKQENCQAVAKLLDQPTVEISTSETEFEGWNCLLGQNFRRLNTLKIAWRIKSRSPDQESSFNEASEDQYAAFFEALRNNESIRCLHIRAKHDGEAFTQEKISLFFKYLQRGILKKNLQELEIEMKIKASGHLRSSIEGAAYQSNKVRPLQDLLLLKIHTFMKDKDLEGICEALQKSAVSLETLHLEGLEHGTAGFKSLVRLLKCNHSIRNLHISMNQSLFVNPFGCRDDNSNNYAPVVMRTELRKMPQTAVRKSKVVFLRDTKTNSCEKNENGSCPSICETMGDKSTETLQGETCQPFSRREVNPKVELRYLFDKLSPKNGPWNVEAYHCWHLRRHNCETRIPLPLCVSGEHKSVFHYVFSALPETHVESLSFNQAGVFLSPTDIICLGHAVRKSQYLAAVNLRGLEKVESYLPLLIGIGQSTSLTSVNLTSANVVVNDSALEVICCALQSNLSLRNLCLGRWHFNLNNVSNAQKFVSTLVGAWQVSVLDLRQCIVEVNSGSEGTPTSPVVAPLEAFFSQSTTVEKWKSLKTLNLEGVEIRQANKEPCRGHKLLRGVTKFSNLDSLDLSMSQYKVIQMDNNAVIELFQLISSEMKQLGELKLDYWEFALELDGLGTELSSRLRLCRKLKKVQLRGVNENIAMNKDVWCKNTFLHQLISYLPSLEEISLCNYRINNNGFDTHTAAKLATCLHDHFHHTPFSVTFFNLSSDVENIIYQQLQRPSFRVKKNSALTLLNTFEVKRSLSLVKSMKPRS